MSQDVVSFVLRFVREAGEQQDARWRGSVRHVQGAAEQQFTQFSEALSFMQSQLNHSVEAAQRGRAAARTANPWLETAKLWGEFVPQMNELLLGSVRSVLHASTAVPAELSRSLVGGRPAEGDGGADDVAAELRRLREAVERLQADVRTLKGTDG